MDQRLSGVDSASQGVSLVRRFGLATRLVHWGLAVPFVLLLLTGLTNYWPELKAIHLGGARLLAWLHVVLGFAMVGVAVALGAGALARRDTRRDAREVARVGMDDYLWLQHQGLRLAGEASNPPRVGKFNAGQKLNALASAGVTAGLLGTGTVLGVNYVSKTVFSVGLVEPVFRWHTALALLFVPVLLGHVYLAVVHPSTRESLRGMTRGMVRREWARRHHPSWVSDLEREEGAGTPRGSR
ncbi:MAG: cytochrome b/b6 domain-containing protein [Dehalococcoidia bacterium]